MRQVRRCKAEPEDGLINPATPRSSERIHSQVGSIRWKLMRVQHKLTKYTQSRVLLLHVLVIFLKMISEAFSLKENWAY